MNLDFAAAPGYSSYVVLLMLSGVAMIAIASPMIGGLSRWTRLLNAAFGIGYLGYGFYLAFLFQGGTYYLFFKALLLPLLLIARTIRSARAGRSGRSTAVLSASPAGSPAPMARPTLPRPEARQQRSSGAHQPPRRSTGRVRSTLRAQRPA